MVLKLDDHQIYEKVVSVLVDTLRSVDRSKIEGTSRLERDLGMESVDFPDFTERLQVEFGVGGELLEVYWKAPPNPDEALVENGKITDRGIKEIRAAYPSGDFRIIDATRDYGDIDSVMTVNSVVSYIKSKLNGVAETPSQ